MQGFFVTFEGIEHCGKTTQADALVSRLESDGHEVVLTREPGGTPLGHAIRDLLLHQTSSQVDTVAELLLFAADRAQHVNTRIRPALDAGKVVISDRFYDSTRAYQGYGREIPMDLIDRAILLATDGLTPDLSILVDIDGGQHAAAGVGPLLFRCSEHGSDGLRTVIRQHIVAGHKYDELNRINLIRIKFE